MASPTTATQQLLTQLATQIDALTASETADASAIAAAQATLTQIQAAVSQENQAISDLKSLEAVDIAALKAQLSQVTGVANTPVDLSAVTAAIATLNTNLAALTVKVNALSSASPSALVAALLPIIGPNGIKIDGVLSGSSSGGTAGGGTTSGGSPGATIPPVITEVLTLPTDWNGSYPVNLGTGPDSLTLRMSPNVEPSEFDVVINLHTDTETRIAKGLKITGGYSVAGVAITLNGTFGSRPTFDLIGSGAGLADCYLVSATLNGIPYYFFGDDDSRSDVQVANVMPTYNSERSQDLHLGPFDASKVPIPGVTGPATFATDYTLINGQTAEQIAAPGGPITLPAQRIIGTLILQMNSTLTGAGVGLTTLTGIDAAAAPIEPEKDMGLVLLNGNNTVSLLTIDGDWIPDALGYNAAGIRNHGPTGTNHTINGVEITHCQNGILSDTDGYTLQNCHIHHNGALSNHNTPTGTGGDYAGPGNTHNLYLGGSPATVHTIQDSVIEMCRDAHEVKSRAGTTIGARNKITTGGNGSAYDIPNGGNVTIDGDVWTLLASALDHNIFTYAMENANNVATGKHTKLSNLLINDPGNLGPIIQNGTNVPDATLEMVNCTYTGVTPDIRGFLPANITGAFTKAG